AHGGNDYWEAGLVEPHIVLADFIKILHPDHLPEHALKFYKKLD
ncbi:MAG: ABC transporter substrate-binding protein, partial [Gemmatimonadetes bacterium]|nr:ABC transporter substrate-binding protein [Gemmatimonadota bacterium]